MTRELPPQPDLEQLKTQAKELLKAWKAGDAQAIGRIREGHARAASAATGNPKLNDAQLVIAREYGFASWPKLKEHVEAGWLERAISEFHKALREDNVGECRRLLEGNPRLKAKINEPVGEFQTPIIQCARSREMLDALVDAGADINAKSRWWAGGFGYLHTATPELARHAIARGAKVDVHAAARLGMVDELKDLVTANPGLVHERGGDGQTPLHFAATIEVAEYLLDQGGDIDARDVDHESTPAQHMLGDRREVARYLVQRGCHTDILMAAALGEEALVKAHLDRDPDSIHMRVSEKYFPMAGGKAGGTIYQWTLGWYVSAHQVANKFGHEGILELLMERSPAALRLITACWLGDEALVNSLRGEPVEFEDDDARQVAHAARNNDMKALRSMIEAGLPVTGRSQHNATALHWAAWHGNAEMTRLILNHKPALEDNDNDFKGTPLRWAIHGSENGWHRDKGDYAATVEALIRAGAEPPREIEGTEAVRAVLRRGQ